MTYQGNLATIAKHVRISVIILHSLNDIYDQTGDVFGIVHKYSGQNGSYAFAESIMVDLIMFVFLLFFYILYQNKNFPFGFYILLSKTQVVSVVLII